MLDCNEVYKFSKDLNVLYIEDDKNFSKETCELFNEFFKKVVCVYDGEAGINEYLKYYNINKEYYNLVITDISIPKKDGLELIKAIYKMNKTQSIIVISAHNNSENLLELVNIGIEQFLLKPLDFEKVLKTIYTCSLKLKNEINYTEDTNIIVLSKNFTYKEEEKALYKNEVQVKLTKKESELLEILIRNKTKISTFNEIYSILWADSPELASQELLKPIVSRFRKKLSENKLESVYALGYKLIF